MKFGFAPQLSVEVTKHSAVITAMGNELKDFIKDKNYGDDIAGLYIGIVSVSPQFSQFFKARSPKYTKGKNSYTKDDVHYEFYNSFEYEVRLDFETLKNASEKEVQKLIAEGLLSSFDVFKKFKKFDSDQFKSDLEGLVKAKGWI